MEARGRKEGVGEELGWAALMARRHSWLQTPKDIDTERVRQTEEVRAMEAPRGAKR